MVVTDVGDISEPGLSRLAQRLPRELYGLEAAENKRRREEDLLIALQLDPCVSMIIYFGAKGDNTNDNNMQSETFFVS